MTALIGIIMGSQSDWPTLRHAADDAGRDSTIPHERASSRPIARRTGCGSMQLPRAERGLRVIIAGAGGAAHLPGHVRRLDRRCRCSACRSKSHSLKGMDSLLSIVQMPAGIPVGTLAIGRAGAVNAALLAAAILATGDAALAARLDAFRARADQGRRGGTRADGPQGAA